MLNGIISLHIFSGAENKRREKIRSTIKSALEIFIKGLEKDNEYLVLNIKKQK
jgi:hypothetical protein